MKADIEIEGRGFFSITGITRKGRSWVDHRCQVSASGQTCSDDQNLTQEIAEGATQDGLKVSVNGFLYMSGGLRGKPVAA